jgi:motility quorum-sensing regulator / GCU-specific mRNA interferase toxin
MEKGTPHCKLSTIKAIIESGHIRATASALAGAAAFGLDFHGMIDVVSTLTPRDFHKSMTTHADHRVWQDVYRPTTAMGHGLSKTHGH